MTGIPKADPRFHQLGDPLEGRQHHRLKGIKFMWAWRVTAIIDLYAQVRDGCFDMKQFLIDRIPVGKLR
jgi:hypothetical protein